ncbi:MULTISPECIES: DUF2293 domain-containing protein [Brucella]|mgnify:FL=1|jgi:hypothetical protein|uniref:DUF2293 domain-containing protein n=1 Tax=Brucella/Ochrobactrum group TaxID=2826938 RepID=UPI0007DA795E|nr:MULTISPECIES: DUF2293 domain-containing protein [Brucella]MBK0021415.1 DUF2293 domain-containing protein [Ochrobactrum sp. S45]MBK0041847.1 DUF2293 domain-containing protein [Ochrobactrum sp. S46]MBO1023477.1 DUF2293 domain-containing protein [Ochrobactrum sp. SD129]MQP39153.1 DUF2293 domain-containing protein [Ochrobactrum sp. MYb237]QWK76902.1 DUF2293 domain-containing protein [Ochrobactrum sp. BTU1]
MGASTVRQKAIAKSLTLLLPAVPYSDSEPIRAAALAPHMKTLPPSVAVWLATVAHVRHAHTDYDTLRDDGYDKDSARFFVLDDINKKLTEWRATRLVTADDDEKVEM